MVLLQRLTAEAMLGAPRRSPAQPNHDGTLALYTVSTHAFGDKTSSEVRVMDVDTGSSWRIADAEKVHDVNWVPGPRNDVIFLKSGEKGVTTIGVVSDVRGKENTYSVAEINAPIQALRMRWIEPGRVAFAVVGLVGPDGQLFNDEAAEKKSTIQVYDDFRVRSVSCSLTPLNSNTMLTGTQVERLLESAEVHDLVHHACLRGFSHIPLHGQVEVRRPTASAC